MCQLARLHHNGSAITRAADGWDYESELVASASETVEAYLLSRSRGLPILTRVLERTAGVIRQFRRQLLSAYGETTIHGDVHPRNAIVSKHRSRSSEVLLIDWARARTGSPLEDVCSWLHSVAFWEPEARRRHDTLLATYMRVAHGTDRLSRELRDAYWLAGASNAFAGALRYHLTVLNNSPTRIQHRNAVRATCDWLRIIRRADAVWRA
jgi:Ser/Thr protein kinase RdoA (MazF antagonist)